MHAKDPYEAKHQFLIRKRESVSLKRFKNPKAFIGYSKDMQDVYKNIDEYNTDIIAHMINNKKRNSVVTELFIRGTKLNILSFLLRNQTSRLQNMLD